MRTSAAIHRSARPVLPDNICFRLQMTQMAMFREFYRVFDGSRITPAVHAVLQIIRDNPGIGQRQLGDLLMIRAPNMTRMIQQLVDSSLVERQIDPTDRRAFKLSITQTGQGLLDDLAGRATRLEERLLGALAEEERKALRLYLGRIMGKAC